MNCGLIGSQIVAIHTVLQQHQEVEQAVLYGSRAMGTFDEWSDIDLTLKGTHITPHQLNEIDEQLDDLLLPYFMDVSVYESLKNSDLVDHINRVGLVLYERKKE